MPIISATAAVDRAITTARSLPGLISNLEQVAPGLAKQLEAKPLLLAKSPPVVLLAMLIGWVSAKYGFGWDSDTTLLVSSVCVLGAGYAMRAITKQPTSGLVAITPPVVADGAVTGPFPPAA